MKKNQPEMLEMKNLVSQVKSSMETLSSMEILTNRVDGEDRISELEDKVPELEHSSKGKEKILRRY